MNDPTIQTFARSMRPPFLPILLTALVAATTATVLTRSQAAPPPPGPEPLSAAGEACVDALHQFSSDLFGELAKASNGENVVASPWSVWSSLATFATFSEESTREEIVGALGFGSGAVTNETLRAGRAEILERMERAGRFVSLRASQAIWVERTLELDPDAAASLRAERAIDLRRVDFRGRADESAAQIARWIRSSTDGSAQSAAKDVEPWTDLVLTDATSLRARWRYPFDERRTSERPFTRADGSKVLVQTMTHELAFGMTGREDPKFAAIRLHEEDERAAATAIELPHRGERTSLVLVVPDRTDGLAEVEQRLDITELGTRLDGAERRTVKVFLPRFSLRRSVDLRPALRALGVKAAFEEAGLARLFRDPLPGRVVGRISHGAALDVDEHGVRSWARTEWHVFAAVPDVVNANRPFLVLVRERTSGAILFFGRILDPST